ncbi:MAG: DUF493 domain-containing protein [Gammaproteobacteria bacterium CG_4_10_14_0_8_um_filter_38_16]|nr:MAG: DUF493 domain-containing protein [Gammaproteobacteria bacterium CG_4_10_14_0_8_um_filter_38_16]PJA03057.1 MAG: DUF493 domain-containing protein [Gammaproteobacteria bacterium CG_4_10_14_0_2_um_filter_38_22]PJB10213.1 MAG: DUF493 domain-containing protein [Gammaproteobacteria bacterium CG_4_9_14_3_um_filter_38_9]
MSLKPNGHHQETSPIQFPCDFTIKIMGRTDSHFEKIALALVKQHFPDFNTIQMQKKLSKDNHFLSLSVTVYAESKAQLDTLYQELSSTKEILMVL